MSDPTSDAHLVQIVRSALGRKGRGVNVSSRGFVVALHGVVVDKLRRNEKHFAS